MSDSLSKGFYNGKPNPFEVGTYVRTHAPVFLYRTVRVIVILYRSEISAPSVLFTERNLVSVKNTISALNSFIWKKLESAFCFCYVFSYSLSFSPTLCGFLLFFSLFMSH